MPLHPGAWVAWALGASAIALTTTNPFYLTPLFAAAVAVHAAWARPEARRSFRTFVALGAATVVLRTALVVLGPVTEGSVAAAFLEGVRVAVLLSVYGALSSVSDPYAILRLAPRRFHEPALAAALALTLAPRTIEAGAQVREAQRVRGIDLGRLAALPALAVPVLEAGMEQAVTLAESMDARGHGRGRRSRYRPHAFGGWSWATVAVAASAAGAFIVSAIVGGPTLATDTWPLTWPAASGRLVAAAVTMGLPALWPRDP